MHRKPVFVDVCERPIYCASRCDDMVGRSTIVSFLSDISTAAEKNPVL